MKKNPLLIRLMTAFTAVIGLNVIALTAYIFAYAHFAGEFPLINTRADSSHAVPARSGYITLEAPTSASPVVAQRSLPSGENRTSVISNSSSNETAAGFDPAKQERFEELAARGQHAREQERQLFVSSVENSTDHSSEETDEQQPPVSVQNAQAGSIPEQRTTKPVTAAPASQESTEPVQNLQPNPPPVQTSTVTDTPTQSVPDPAPENDTDNSSSGSSGNASNFYTYDNPEPPDSGYTYVYNTNTGKIHYSTCYHVDKMKEEHRLRCNSFDDVIAQGYKPDPCKTCRPVP